MKSVLFMLTYISYKTYVPVWWKLHLLFLKIYLHYGYWPKQFLIMSLSAKKMRVLIWPFRNSMTTRQIKEGWRLIILSIRYLLTCLISHRAVPPLLVNITVPIPHQHASKTEPAQCVNTSVKYREQSNFIQTSWDWFTTCALLEHIFCLVPPSQIMW